MHVGHRIGWGVGALWLSALECVAASYILTATPRTAVAEPFSIRFDDTDGDGLVSPDEITWFSGFQSGVGLMVRLEAIAAIPGVTDGETLACWAFHARRARTETTEPTMMSPDFFDYAIRPTGPPPISETLWVPTVPGAPTQTNPAGIASSEAAAIMRRMRRLNLF